MCTSYYWTNFSCHTVCVVCKIIPNISFSIDIIFSPNFYVHEGLIPLFPISNTSINKTEYNKEKTTTNKKNYSTPLDRHGEEPSKEPWEEPWCLMRLRLLPLAVTVRVLPPPGVAQGWEDAGGTPSSNSGGGDESSLMAWLRCSRLGFSPWCCGRQGRTTDENIHQVSLVKLENRSVSRTNTKLTYHVEDSVVVP